MAGFSSQAIILRRISYGDYDLIITFFTISHGKFSAIAKAAKKSTKRFAGILEPFSVLEIVCSAGRGKGLPILKEASLIHPFDGIRADIQKTAYASYWAEMLSVWLEEDQAQVQVYRLFEYALRDLGRGEMVPANLSILFQLRFLTLAGLGPNLICCSQCKTAFVNLRQASFGFDLARGGLICSRCENACSDRPRLSKGTVKQLLWIQKMDLATAARVRFSTRAQQEGLIFLEAFVPYHLGRTPRSLKILRQVRGR